jgi:hypothetical protein
VGNSGFYLRGNDIQVIDSGASNSGKYPAVKFSSVSVRVGSIVTIWGTRIKLKGFRAENINGYAALANKVGLVTIYNDFKLRSVTGGLFEKVFKNYVFADASLFVEYTWNGIGGKRLHGLPVVVPFVPVAQTPSPVLTPAVAPQSWGDVPCTLTETFAQCGGKRYTGCTNCEYTLQRMIDMCVP